MQLHEQCPSAFQRKYITKEPTSSEGEVSEAMTRGTRIHRDIEHYLLGHVDDLPHEALSFEQMLKTLREERDVRPEAQWAFDENWEQVSFGDKEHARVRGILDIAYQHEDTAHVKELKTGKVYKEHATQRSLYGLAGALMFPEAKVIQVDTIYLDAGIVHPTTFNDWTTPTQKWNWERRINAVQPPKPYPQKASWKCKFCAYHEVKGGTCNGKST